MLNTWTWHTVAERDDNFEYNENYLIGGPYYTSRSDWYTAWGSQWSLKVVDGRVFDNLTLVYESCRRSLDGLGLADLHDENLIHRPRLIQVCYIFQYTVSLSLFVYIIFSSTKYIEFKRSFLYRFPTFI